jgi:rare lipoprotein A
LARYTGRHHVRQPRPGAQADKKRSPFKSSRQLLPTAAALAVASFLIGGGGLVIKFGAPAQVPANAAYGYDAADYPPADRGAQLNRAARKDLRLPDSASLTTPASDPTTQAAGTAKTAGSNQVGNASVISTGSCEASYGNPRTTANGETFAPTALTAAHKTLPFNSMVRVTNVANNKSVVVRINDRGPFVAGRCLGLSTAAFSSIASLSAGTANVRYEVLGPAAA